MGLSIVKVKTRRADCPKCFRRTSTERLVKPAPTANCPNRELVVIGATCFICGHKQGQG